MAELAVGVLLRLLVLISILGAAVWALVFMAPRRESRSRVAQGELPLTDLEIRQMRIRWTGLIVAALVLLLIMNFA